MREFPGNRAGLAVRARDSWQRGVSVGQGFLPRAAFLAHLQDRPTPHLLHSQTASAICELHHVRAYPHLTEAHFLFIYLFIVLYIIIIYLF